MNSDIDFSDVQLPDDALPLGPVMHTARGFPYVPFEDSNRDACILQQSSLADDLCIWLGIADPAPKILASKAAARGVATNQTTGWVPFPIPEGVPISTSMHLNKEKARSLIAALQHWVDFETLEQGEIDAD